MLRVNIYSSNIFIFRDKVKGTTIGATNLTVLGRKTNIPVSRFRWWFREPTCTYFENDEVQITKVFSELIFKKDCNLEFNNRLNKKDHD